LKRSKQVSNHFPSSTRFQLFLLAFFVVVIEMIILLWESPTYNNKISDLSYTCTRLKFQVSTAPLMQ
jgi:hypothetical protein